MSKQCCMVFCHLRCSKRYIYFCLKAFSDKLTSCTAGAGCRLFNMVDPYKAEHIIQICSEHESHINVPTCTVVVIVGVAVSDLRPDIVLTTLNTIHGTKLTSGTTSRQGTKKIQTSNSSYVC